MTTKNLSIRISSTIGAISAEVISPSAPKAIMTLAHGAGAGMHHAFMVTLSELLAAHDIATFRFNFPFTENKKGRPDTPAVAHQTIEAAITKAKGLYPELPLFAAGKSFGGRMTSQFLAAKPDLAVKGIIFYGFPLHPPGKPSVERADHLKQIRNKMLFFQGTKDELATWELIEPLCASLKTATLVKIEGGNHAFKAGKINVPQLLADSTNEWIAKLIKKTK